ncbi:hypothetical protein K1T71_001110 [Dendrolimus kikuchii]|uniref:Uncharacterized protein n=1 Tax=Dendrolimus kikuchii TaxID=765133 RepID=A0ACC1DGP7_9NEOP|nr:hypothetical protein K1T71_001110 [Dendrolimus kikuchii]
MLIDRQTVALEIKSLSKPAQASNCTINLSKWFCDENTKLSVAAAARAVMRRERPRSTHACRPRTSIVATIAHDGD